MIWVTFQKEGIHRYPAAATDPKLADVSFLAHPHRHIFHFNVALQVYHDDRDVEFIQFKRWLEQEIDVGSIDYKSCEMLCDMVATIVASKHETAMASRRLMVEVSEDGENGSTCEYWI
jgi:replicative DNA helicase